MLKSISFNFAALDEIGLTGSVDVVDLTILCYVYLRSKVKGFTGTVRLSPEIVAGFTPYAGLKRPCSLKKPDPFIEPEPKAGNLSSGNLSAMSLEAINLTDRLKSMEDCGLLYITSYDGATSEVAITTEFMEKCRTSMFFSAWEKDNSPDNTITCGNAITPDNTCFGKYPIPAETLLREEFVSGAINFIEKYVHFDAPLSEPSALSSFLDVYAGVIKAETQANGMEMAGFSVYDPRSLKETRAIAVVLLQAIKSISTLLDEGNHRLNSDQVRDLLMEYVKASCEYYASLGIKKVAPSLMAGTECASAFGQSMDGYSPIEGRKYFVKAALGLG
ncbi:MAG: hypothetical protein HQK89_07610 [Nitrospirae bacterium]|nr:hypothetical protein [Nitrospirota bacterium]